MKKKISIFKKIGIFRSFSRTIRENSSELEQKYSLRIDNANRMYTVLNIPEEIIGEPYNLRKTDIDKISEKFIKEFSTDLSKYLDSKGLKELYEYYKIEKVDKYSYLIVVGFSLFKSDKYFNNIYYKIIPAILVATILSLIFFL
jgi:hypothetical protein